MQWAGPWGQSGMILAECTLGAQAGASTGWEIPTNRTSRANGELFVECGGAPPLFAARACPGVLQPRARSKAAGASPGEAEREQAPALHMRKARSDDLVECERMESRLWSAAARRRCLPSGLARACCNREPEARPPGQAPAKRSGSKLPHSTCGRRVRMILWSASEWRAVYGVRRLAAAVCRPGLPGRAATASQEQDPPGQAPAKREREQAPALHM